MPETLRPIAAIAVALVFILGTPAVALAHGADGALGSTVEHSPDMDPNGLTTQHSPDMDPNGLRAAVDRHGSAGPHGATP